MAYEANNNRRGVILAGLGISALPGAAHALMAGLSPDSPAVRVDPNNSGSPWSGAVSVVVNGSPYSGTVISPQHVITAAHVLGGAQAAAVQCVVNLAATPVSLQVSQIAVYPTASFPYDDLAILTLSQPVPAGTMIYPIVDQPQNTGVVITLVGYGGSGNGNSGPAVGGSSTIKRSGRNVIDRLTPSLDQSGRSGAFYVHDFDGPTGTGALGGGTLGNAVETGVAGGDSGSGAFIQIGSGPALYGVNNAAVGFQQNGPAIGFFGHGGAGLILSHAPYLAWIQQQTGNSIELSSSPRDSDVPLPWWASGLLATGLLLGGSIHRLRSVNR